MSIATARMRAPKGFSEATTEMSRAHTRMAGPAGSAVNDSGHHHTDATFGQAAGELCVGGEAGSQIGDLFGRLVRVRNGHHLRRGRADGFKQESLAVHAFQHPPAHLVDAVGGGLRHQRGIAVVAEALHGGGQARIHHPDLFQEAAAVECDGLFIRLARGQVALPVPLPGGGRFGDLALDESVGPVHHAAGEVFFPGEDSGAGKRLGGLRACGGRHNGRPQPFRVHEAIIAGQARGARLARTHAAK